MSVEKDTDLTGNQESSDEVLYTSRWNEIRLKDGWYEYVHSPWSKGIGVAVLAYRKSPKTGNTEYLGRYELTPSHSDEIKLCSITGGYDNSDEFTILGCALNELEEEGGYKAPTKAVTPLGTVYPSKGSDTVQHLFAVDIDYPGVESVEPVGDGTRGEEGSYVKWVDELDLVGSEDPLNHAMLMRLQAVNRMKELQELALKTPDYNKGDEIG